MSRILVVEDLAVTARALARMLTRHGHEVDVAATAAEARAHLGVTQYAVVVADYGLPDAETGLDLLAAVRDAQPDSARILISGCVFPDMSPETDTWYSFLVKPFAPNQLTTLIQILTLESRKG